jgi:hypothetical protein
MVKTKDYYSYIIYSDGRVFSKNKNIFMIPQNNGNGYLKLSLSIKGKFVNKYIHRLVAKAFIENTENKPEVDHIDTDKTNNSYKNLRWVTRKENANHYKGNRYKAPRTKCKRRSKEDVKLIKKLLKNYTTVEIGKILDIPRQTVYGIKRRLENEQ